MGSWVGIKETRIEARLRREKSNGVSETSSAWPGDSSNQALRRAPGDIRPQVPPLGLREYWYPALSAKKVGRKPFFWSMLGDEMVFFRDRQGEVVAMTDVCPHRGASLSQGASYYKGFVSCPYHGATFDGQGECVAFLPEGPDSKMVGQLRARTYPTQTLRGWVFVWMGDGEPAPIEEDVPPEFFEPGNVVVSTYTYWPTNWLLAIENHSDSHNAFYLHRNSLKQLMSVKVGRNRTPTAPEGKIVHGRGLITRHVGSDYYAKNGEVPYQLYYPGVDGMWPRRRLRLLWMRFLSLFTAPRDGAERFKKYEEWGLGHHLPCVVRTGGGSTRYAVAVQPNLSRIIYFYFPRSTNRIRSAITRLLFHVVQSPLELAFSSQDGRAAASCRFWTPEYLSPTDSQVVFLRKLITQHSRDAERLRAGGNGKAREEAESLEEKSQKPSAEEIFGSLQGQSR